MEVEQDSYGIVSASFFRQYYQEHQNEGGKLYPVQIMGFNIEDPIVEANPFEGYLTLRFTPISGTVYDFQMYEGNHSHLQIKVITKRPGKPTQLLHAGPGKQTPQYKVLSEQDRIHLGEFFKKDYRKVLIPVKGVRSIRTQYSIQKLFELSIGIPEKNRIFE